MTDYRINYGQDFNFFKKIAVSNPTSNADPNDGYVLFGDYTDGYRHSAFIPFTTQGIMLSNEGSGVIEFSFNGHTVSGELNSATASKTLTFENRSVCKIWLRVASGSSGPINCTIQAW